MKTPKLSAREVVMLVFLVVLLIAVIYYMAFYTPLQAELATIETETTNLETQIASYQEKLAQMNRMQAEIDKILSQPADSITELAPYDNLVTVLNDLDTYLRRYTVNYSVSHGTPKVYDDSSVRRYVSLKIVCDDLDSAYNITKEFTENKWRCIVSDLSVSSTDANARVDSTGVALSLSLVFLEYSETA